MAERSDAALARFLFVLKSVRLNFHGLLNYIYKLAGAPNYMKRGCKSKIALEVRLISVLDSFG